MYCISPKSIPGRVLYKADSLSSACSGSRLSRMPFAGCGICLWIQKRGGRCVRTRREQNAFPLPPFYRVLQLRPNLQSIDLSRPYRVRPTPLILRYPKPIQQLRSLARDKGLQEDSTYSQRRVSVYDRSGRIVHLPWFSSGEHPVRLDHHQLEGRNREAGNKYLP